MQSRAANLVHFSRGRIRLRSPLLKGRHRSKLAIREEFETLPAVRRVEVNHRTGSILLLYSPQALEDGTALDNLLARLTSVFSPVNVGRVKIWRAGNAHISLGFDKRIPSRVRTGILGTLGKIAGIRDIHTDPASGNIEFGYDSAVVVRHIRLIHNNLRSGNWGGILRMLI